MGPVELQCGFFGARPFMLCLYLAQLINRTDALPVVIPVSVMKRELVSCPGVSSGAGIATTSGAIVIRSANAGDAGVSGVLIFSSGSSSSGTTGSVSIGSGAATDGKGGAVSITVGSGDSGAGGELTLTAGKSTVLTGGAIGITSGQGAATTSGAITIVSANAGAKGVSGVLVHGRGVPQHGADLFRARAVQFRVGCQPAHDCCVRVPTHRWTRVRPAAAPSALSCATFFAGRSSPRK